MLHIRWQDESIDWLLITGPILGIKLTMTKTWRQHRMLQRRRKSLKAPFTGLLMQFFFGKIGRTASDEVTLQLVLSKCVSVLLYGLGACPLNASDIRSPDFVINRFFTKLFKTTDIEIVKYCQYIFKSKLPSVRLSRLRKRFLASCSSVDNSICRHIQIYSWRLCFCWYLDSLSLAMFVYLSSIVYNQVMVNKVIRRSLYTVTQLLQVVSRTRAKVIKRETAGSYHQRLFSTCITRMKYKTVRLNFTCITYDIQWLPEC